MSYVLDGKVANQSPRKTMNGSVRCAKCNKQLSPPDILTLGDPSSKIAWTINSYLHSSSFIYETLCGIAVVYCSKYCRDKHNHRFTK